MKHFKPMKTIASLFGHIFVLLTATGPLQLVGADGFSGLLGQDLSFVKGRETIGEFFRGNDTKLSGNFTRITITEDTETRLRFRIEYSGYTNCHFECSVLDADRKVMRDFRAAPTQGADAVSFAVDLDPTYNRSQEISCDFLELRVLRDKGRGSSVRQYTLPKRWRTRVTAENLVIPVSLKPLKSAMMLPTVAPAGQESAPPPVQQPGPVISPRVEAPRLSHQAVANAQIRVAPGITVSPAIQGGPVAGRPVVARQAIPVPAAKQHIVTATTPVAQMLPQSAKSVRFVAMPRGLAQEDVQRGAQGPSSRQINLLEAFNPDVNLLPKDVSPISLNLYLDKNPKSGICYFRPNGYNLGWDSDSGYAIRMLYKASTTEGQPGNVLVAARLDSGVDSSEIQLTKDLIGAYRARHSDFTFTELRPLPVDEEPKVSLSSGLQRLFDIPADRIALTSLADALAEIQIQWVNDVTTLENIEAALKEEIGISGKLSLLPSGGGLPAQEMPLQIRFASAETIGFIPWQRGQKWRNATLFPIRLKYLHALAIETNTPVVYTWALGDAEIPSKARASFEDHAVPPWLDSHIKKFWIQYAIRASDEDAKKQVVEQITGGATSIGPTQLVFRTLRPIADTSAYQINLRVRSRFFQARSKEMIEKSDLVLDKDDKDFSAGAIYKSGRAVDEPLAEFTLSVVLPDGSTFPGISWITVTDSSRVFIGKVQLQQATGHDFSAR
jgi:hypothetical protein